VSRDIVTSSAHKALVTRAQEFMDQRWRDDLTLEHIASHVCMSPFHFQRIFKEQTGETPKEYLIRIRLENAIQRIYVDRHMSVFNVALECGFSSQAAFARAFRQKFGVSATEFRNLSFSEVAKLAAGWEASIQKIFQHLLLKRLTPKEEEKLRNSITLKRIERLTVIYRATTMISEELIGEEFQKLANRADAYDLEVDTSQCFGAMYDFPLHTPLEKCRYRACIGIAGDSAKHPKFSSMTLSGGKYGVFPVKGDIELMIRYSIFFFSDWLKASHFQRSEESYLYLERFSALPGPKTYTKTAREIYVPLKPA
jgi:AraC family transcriptional regulator